MNILRIILLSPFILIGILWGGIKIGLEMGEKIYNKLFE